VGLVPASSFAASKSGQNHPRHRAPVIKDSSGVTFIPDGGMLLRRVELWTILWDRHSRCLSSHHSHACCGIAPTAARCADAARTRRRGDRI